MNAPHTDIGAPPDSGRSGGSLTADISRGFRMRKAGVVPDPRPTYAITARITTSNRAKALMHFATSTVTVTLVVIRCFIGLNHRATPAQPVWVTSSRSALRINRRSRIYRPAPGALEHRKQWRVHLLVGTTLVPREGLVEFQEHAWVLLACSYPDCASPGPHTAVGRSDVGASLIWSRVPSR